MSEAIVGAQLYTVREYTKTPADIARTLARISSIGYRAVQVSGIGPIKPAELRKMLDDEGLKAVATHTPLQRLVGETDAVIEEHRVLGVPYIACPGLPPEMHNAAGYRRAAGELSETGRILAGRGITLGYHNHAIEFEKYDGKTGLEIILSECDPNYLQPEIDTYWVAHGGGDPAEWCRRFKGRLLAVHLKDMGIIDNTQVMMEVGEGNLNWEAVLAACREAGTRFYLVEQDTCRRDPFESLKISLDNLRGMGLKG